MTDAPERLWVGPRYKPIGWHSPLATPYPEDADDEAEYVRADILEANIATEREACAKVAEDSIIPNEGFKELASNLRAERIAAAIRARKDTE